MFIKSLGTSYINSVKLRNNKYIFEKLWKNNWHLVKRDLNLARTLQCNIVQNKELNFSLGINNHYSKSYFHQALNRNANSQRFFSTSGSSGNDDDEGDSGKLMFMQYFNFFYFLFFLHPEFLLNY